MKPTNTLDQHDVLRIIRTRVNAAPSQAEFARRAGVSPPHLCMILGGIRPPTEAMLAAACIKRVVSVHYEIVEQEKTMLQERT